MAVPRWCLFMVLFSFYCLSASSSQIVVDIRNDLPKTTHEPLELRCDKGSSFYMKLGEHYKHTVVQDSECTAMWTPFFTTLDVYQSQRDNPHRKVYWSVRKDGFYLSWDASNWNLVEPWYSD